MRPTVVVARHVALGDARLGKDHAVRVADGDAGDLLVRATSGVSLGFSNLISSASLSSRRPRKLPCRMCPSAVNSAKSTSTTRSGVTHCAPRGDVDGTSATGLVLRGRKAVCQRLERPSSCEAGAHAPAIAQSVRPVLAHQQRGKGAASLVGGGVAAHDELLPPGALDLDPVLRAPSARRWHRHAWR